MKKRGRPAKQITENDKISLKILLESSPFLTLNQERVLAFLGQPLTQLKSEQLTQLKTALREKVKYEQRQELLESIKLKQQNQQRLNRNEIEILDLAKQPLNRDLFFRLDRALQTYQNLSKAIQADKIRIEDEKHREAIRQRQDKTEAQKRRQAENQLKYALGGILLSVLKENRQHVDINTVESIRLKLKQELHFRKF